MSTVTHSISSKNEEHPPNDRPLEIERGLGSSGGGLQPADRREGRRKKGHGSTSGGKGRPAGETFGKMDFKNTGAMTDPARPDASSAPQEVVAALLSVLSDDRSYVRQSVV